MKETIYQRAKRNGCFLECTCVGIGTAKWDELMKGARKAKKQKVARLAYRAGVISKEDFMAEMKRPAYNPYAFYVTRTHIIYVNSGIEHFIKVN